jgi:hypothetical protein
MYGVGSYSYACLSLSRPSIRRHGLLYHRCCEQPSNALGAKDQRLKQVQKLSVQAVRRFEACCSSRLLLNWTQRAYYAIYYALHNQALPALWGATRNFACYRHLC